MIAFGWSKMSKVSLASMQYFACHGLHQAYSTMQTKKDDTTYVYIVQWAIIGYDCAVRNIQPMRTQKNV